MNGQDKERNSALAEAISALNDYDLVLLLGPDVPFVQDGDRSESIAQDREKYTSILQEMCLEHGLKVSLLDGDYQERYLQAVHLVDALMEENSDA